jgi:hypothetical protein
VTVHSKRTSGSSRSGCSAVGCWVDGFVHALAIRGQAVDLLSLDENPRPKETHRRLRYRAEAGRIAEGIPLAREGGIGRTADGFGGLVDVSSASVEEFAQLPGISSEIARRVVEVRGENRRLRFGARLREPPRPAAPLRRGTP